jgi:cobaltochelatase CobN
MHRIATGSTAGSGADESLVFIRQGPAPIVVITAADTDLQCLGAAVKSLGRDFPAVRAVNLLQLQPQIVIDDYAEAVVQSAQVVVLRLLGGRGYWPYGLEVLRDLAMRQQIALFVLPGDHRPDPDLTSHSTVPLTWVDQLWRYCASGGVENWQRALEFVAHRILDLGPLPPPPLQLSGCGLWPGPSAQGSKTLVKPSAQVGILFYRAHYLAQNLQPVEALCQALAERSLQPLPIYIDSLQEPDSRAYLLEQWQGQIDLLINLTGFALGRPGQDAADLWQLLDIPVLQGICSTGSRDQWQLSDRGLTPSDIAMQVALPEVDGRVITRAISFKTAPQRDPHLETAIAHYEALPDRIDWLADLALAWVTLRRTPASKRRLGVILANYPNRDGRLANGVGLDTPASTVAILQALEQSGYGLEDIPKDSAALIKALTEGYTNDPESQELRPVQQWLPLADYQIFWDQLPNSARTALVNRWGPPQADPQLRPEGFPIAGLQLGHVFLGIQPARGDDRDPSLNYHAPDLEPPHAYLAFYIWLRHQFGAQALVHVGKHGNLEWLPGKSLALSNTCWPEIALGALPHFYPFIVNDPGEGTQAKRRAQAVIVDHLTPPLTRAELYGPLLQLEGLIDEYYDAQTLDPRRLPLLKAQIDNLIREQHLNLDLGQEQRTWSELLTRMDGYLCELKEAQIRDGLHIFGSCPEGDQLRDLIGAIARQPSPNRLGLTRALAQDWGLDFDPLTCEVAEPATRLPTDLPQPPSPGRTWGDWTTWLEERASALIETLLSGDLPRAPGARSAAELAWIAIHLLPALRRTPEELTALLQGLEGRYIPPGPSGAPSRGRPEVLPTGRNFYSVDLRGLPTESAWQLGRLAAEAVVERYTQEQGEYPKSLGLSVWGTSTMRTGGDDIAETLALLGVQPVWDGPSRRVVDLEVLPLSVLERPRVDVTLRVSGLFRDAFPNLIDLVDRAVTLVSHLDEPADWNPLAARVKTEAGQWQAAGLTAEQGDRRARYRIFGSKPGAYGAGLQGLMESQNWENDADLARAYTAWSSYAYGADGRGQSLPEVFQQRLAQMQIVLHNQDNREHDLLDSDDYYQFQGGLTAAVRAVQGQAPLTYFGDHALPENPRVRSLREEISRVYRSRVVNPKWVAGAMRHGYKGAFELSATVDYLFAYDATAHCVEDHMYDGVAQAYLLDKTVQGFIRAQNPWVLRDMAERLLEAHQRGLWQSASTQRLNELRHLSLEAEALVEAGSA